jgi:hypothetical protein
MDGGRPRGCVGDSRGSLGREAGVLHGTAVAIDNYQQCLAAPNHDAKACQETFWKESAKNEKGHWLAAATFGLSPIAIAWAIIFGLVTLVRWIKRGFRPWG